MVTATSDSSPLNRDHLSTLNQVLSMIPETQAIIDKAAKCEMDVGQAQEENATQQRLASKIKQVFFPNEP